MVSLVCSFRASRRHLDDEVLRDRLLALCAEVGDPAENVQLGHVAGGAARAGSRSGRHGSRARSAASRLASSS